jgi:hypothetical protein
MGSPGWLPPEPPPPSTWFGYPPPAWGAPPPAWGPPRRWVLPVLPALPPPPQWYPDPTGRHELRRWDEEWTNDVLDGQRFSRDPQLDENVRERIGAAWDLGALTRAEQSAVVESLRAELIVCDWDGRVLLVDAAEGDMVEAVVRGACPDVVFQLPPETTDAASGEDGVSAERRTGYFCEIDTRHLRRFERVALLQSLAAEGIWFGDDRALLTIASEDFEMVWDIVVAVSG